MQTKALSSVLK